MSFILDALRRAETQRGSQPRPMASDGSLGDIAAKTSAMPSPRWIALLLVAGLAIAMLVINILSPQQDPATPVYAESDYRAPTATAAFSTIAPDTPLAELAQSPTRVLRPLGKEARDTSASSARIEPGTVSISQEPLSATDTPTRTLTNLPDNMRETGRPLPSYAELVLNGRQQMPEFHLDIHVYAPVPERRFVFVNNRKYREGEQLEEGGSVERITPAGVVLNHRGRRFELAPD